MTITDDMLMAWLDGELDPAESARVEAALADDDVLRRRVEVQRKLRARLAARYDPVAEEEVPARLRAMLEGDAPEGDVVDLAAVRARRARPAWQSLAAIAATLVLGIAIGRIGSGGNEGPVTVDGGALVARGALAEALDTRLASAQDPGATTRIGVSFARADGRLCRTFDGTGLAGLACRDENGWQVMMAVPGSGTAQGGYRQAGSATAPVLQAAQEMMAGEPFDAAAERRARNAGWMPVR
jgi:hypothetical protein